MDSSWGRREDLSPGADSMANGRMAEVESSRRWQSAELAYKLPPAAISHGSQAPHEGQQALTSAING